MSVFQPCIFSADATSEDIIYKEYVRDALAYGYKFNDMNLNVSISSTNFNAIEYLGTGVAGYSIKDFNGDGKKELIAVRMEKGSNDYNGSTSKMILQSYTMNSDSEVVFADEIVANECLGGYMLSLFEEYAFAADYEGQSYFCVVDELKTQGTSCKFTILDLDLDGKFNVRECFYDPGYTSGTALYHSDTVSASDIAQVNYGSFKKLYSYEAGDAGSFSEDAYNSEIDKKISKYGLEKIADNYYKDYGFAMEYGKSLYSFIIAKTNDRLSISADTGDMIESLANVYHRCDVTRDGKIDATDASSILSYYAYISTGGTLDYDDFIYEQEYGDRG